jgi:DNA-binding MarR family transcriptional regulator
LSHAAIRWARSIRGLSLGEKLVLIMLADHASETGTCFPSLQLLADDTGLAKPTVSVITRSLADQGLISIRRTGRSSEYSLNSEFSQPELTVQESITQSSGSLNSEFSEPELDNNLQLTVIEPPLERSDDLSDPSEGVKHVRRKPRRGFPPDWQPTAAGIAYAVAKGRSPEWAAEAGAACRDHHIAKGNVFADHDAAFRTWVNNAERFDRPASRAGPGGDRSRPASIVDILDHVHVPTLDARVH